MYKQGKNNQDTIVQKSAQLSSEKKYFKSDFVITLKKSISTKYMFR
jgi:hypothetical protein